MGHLVSVSESVSTKVEDYATNVDKCLDLAIEGKKIENCVNLPSYEEDIEDLNSIINETIDELGKKIPLENKTLVSKFN